MHVCDAFHRNLHVKTGEFRFTNAGHNPPYIKRQSGSVDCLDQRHGPIIGAVEGIDYQESTVVLSGGDTAFIFTDGVTEAMDVEGQLYAESRLEELLGKAIVETTESLANEALQSVEEFATGAEQADDITILAFRLNEQAGQSTAHHEHFVLEPNLTEIDRINDELNDFAKAHGVANGIIQKLKISIDDLVTNIITHGLSGDDHSIEIRFTCSDKQLVVEISDDGIAFNPFDGAKPDTTLSIEDREVGGLGVFLVSELVDDVAYQWHNHRNVVKLLMNLDA